MGIGASVTAESLTRFNNRKPSLEVAPTTLAQRTRRRTKNTSRRNVHP